MSALYLGPPGAGKTLGMTRYCTLPGLERGQRVVTNIPLIEIALSQHLNRNLDGLIRLVTPDEIKAPNFWFTAQNVGETITRGGDLIIIDEAHEFYGSDKKIKSDDEVFRAIRLQRKYTGGPGNWSTNIIFASQAYRDFHPAIREVCDSMYFMQKLTVVGKPDSYRVDIYSDARSSPTRGKAINQLFGTYDKEYFSLYNSYSTGVGGFSSESPGTETVTDDRLNIWNRRFGFGRFSVSMRQLKLLMLIAIPVFVLIAGGTLYYVVIKARNPYAGTSVEAVKASKAEGASVALGMAPRSPTLISSPTGTTAPAPDDELRKGEASNYRLIGFYAFNGLTVAVIADRAGVYRYLSSGFETVNAGPASHIKYRGLIIAPWTGAAIAQPTKSNGILK